MKSGEHWVEVMKAVKSWPAESAIHDRYDDYSNVMMNQVFYKNKASPACKFLKQKKNSA